MSTARKWITQKWPNAVEKLVLLVLSVELVVVVTFVLEVVLVTFVLQVVVS